MKIDAHQHFWNFNPVRDSWINDEMKVVQRDFGPHDLLPLLKEHHIDGCVTVQSDQSEEENAFQLSNAGKWDFIKGVVGWIDLQADNIEERLQYYSGFKKMKGFRHVLQGEPQRNYMLRPAFMNGIALLHKYSFTYDILIYPDQLKFCADFVKAFPEQTFVIDHIAKPYIKDKKIDEWKKDMQTIAAFKNVYCKVSGMLTEANWKGWRSIDFTPYLDVVTNAFGPSRLIYGSDWPVCLVAGSYSAAYTVVAGYFASLSTDEQNMIFGKNAVNFYNLEQ